MMNIRNLAMVAGAALGAGMGIQSSVLAQVAPGWTLTHVADSATPLPGGGALSGVTPYTVMTDGASVAFCSTTGIYLWSAGKLSTIVDSTTPLPGFKGTMSEFGPPFLVQGDVYFIAAGVVDGVVKRGVYRVRDGVIGVVADTNTPSPHGGNFVDFQDTQGSGSLVYVSAHEGWVAFAGMEDGRRGMYMKSPEGDITTVADSITPFPGTTLRLREFRWPSNGGDDIAFLSIFSPQGVYARIGGEYVAFARQGEPAPGGGIFGSGLGTPEVHAGKILFFAFVSGNPGIYRWTSSGVELVANEATLLPGESGPTNWSNGFAFDRGRVALTAIGSNGPTLFAQVNGQMRRVVDSSGMLDGRAVQSLYIEATGFEHRTLAFTAFFADKTRGLYLVQPTCLADWNFDAAANFQDFLDFLTAFFAGNADFNEDDVTNSQDFFDFLAVFFAGC